MITAKHNEATFHSLGHAPVNCQTEIHYACLDEQLTFTLIDSYVLIGMHWHKWRHAWVTWQVMPPTAQPCCKTALIMWLSAAKPVPCAVQLFGNKLENMPV